MAGARRRGDARSGRQPRVVAPALAGNPAERRRGLAQERGPAPFAAAVGDGPARSADGDRRPLSAATAGASGRMAGADRRADDSRRARRSAGLPVPVAAGATPRAAASEVDAASAADRAGP